MTRDQIDAAVDAVVRSADPADLPLDREHPFRLSVRLRNACQRVRVQSLRELSLLTRKEFSRTEKCGEVTVREAEEALALAGLFFHGVPEDPATARQKQERTVLESYIGSLVLRAVMAAVELAERPRP